MGAADPPHARRRRLRRPRRRHRRARRRSATRTRRRSRGRCWPIPIRASARRRRSRWPAARVRTTSTRAESALLELAATRVTPRRGARRDVAVALRQIGDPRFRRLLMPLLYDPAPEVADEAMESVQRRRQRRLHLRADAGRAAPQPPPQGPCPRGARRYGEPVVDTLAYFLRDPEEDIWVRRHIPGTLAQIPSQKSVDVLVAALEERDGFLRYKVDRRRSSACGASTTTLTFPRADRGADAVGRPPLLQLPVAARQPVRQEAARRRLAARRRAQQKMARTQGPHLPAARAHLSVAATSPPRGGRSSTATRAAARARPSISTTS